MATKREKITRTEHIRQYLRKHRSPGAQMPTAVQEGLAEVGVKVTTGLISQVKASMKKKARKKGRRSKADYEYEFTGSHLIAAKKFLEELGGDFDGAKAALDALAKLQ